MEGKKGKNAETDGGRENMFGFLNEVCVHSVTDPGGGKRPPESTLPPRSDHVPWVVGAAYGPPSDELNT